jgi:TonB family protein
MGRDRSALTRGPVHGGIAVCVLALAWTAPAQTAPAPKDVFLAHPAVRYDPKDRCPDLRISDEGDTATVVFMVSAYGTPSQASVRSPSGIQGLDEAAVACVLRLKFQPATRPGDAQPLDAWQQLGLRYAARTSAPAAAAAGSAPVAAAALTGTTTAAVAASSPSQAGGGTSEVHVCADASGRLTQEPVVTRSSGSAALDAAAVKIARSGAASYHPAGSPALSGCAQLKVTFEGR